MGNGSILQFVDPALIAPKPADPRGASVRWTVYLLRNTEGQKLSESERDLSARRGKLLVKPYVRGLSAWLTDEWGTDLHERLEEVNVRHLENGGILLSGTCMPLTGMGVLKHRQAWWCVIS